MIKYTSIHLYFCVVYLQDEEMFRPQARFNLAYDDDIGQDRPILGAVIGAENLVVEVKP